MNEHDDLQHPDESINNIAAFVVEVSRVLKRLDLNTYEEVPEDVVSELEGVALELWPELDQAKPYLEHHATGDPTASNVRYLAHQLGPEMPVEARVQLLSYFTAIQAAEWLRTVP
jgi:hypothetical protein